MSEVKHTPGELRLAKNDPLKVIACILGNEFRPIVATAQRPGPYLSEEEAAANAARIVTTWNCHDSLLAELKHFVERFEASARMAGLGDQHISNVTATARAIITRAESGE